MSYQRKEGMNRRYVWMVSEAEVDLKRKSELSGVCTIYRVSEPVYIKLVQVGRAHPSTGIRVVFVWTTASMTQPIHGRLFYTLVSFVIQSTALGDCKSADFADVNDKYISFFAAQMSNISGSVRMQV